LYFEPSALPLPSSNQFFTKMANHKATQKDTRQAAKRREQNRYQAKTTRNAMRDLKAGTDATAAKKDLPGVLSKIDKLAKKGIIHKNKAANLKSALTKAVAKAS
jgi:small subunit ribosomal protein S20